MAFPCHPPLPLLPGAVPPIPAKPPPVPQLPLDLGNIVIVPPDPPQPPPIPPPAVVRPRFVSDLPLNHPSVLYFLATLARASYAPTWDYTRACALALLGTDAGITFVANGAGLVPGYSVIKMPRGAIVTVSGTTNLGQWMQQVFNGNLTESIDPAHPNLTFKFASIPTYLAAANTILGALVPLVPLDQQILWVGHSMGGAVAQILHACCDGHPSGRVPSRCVTFAAPKAGDYRLANAARAGGFVFRAFVTDQDAVPALPPDLNVVRLAIPPAFQGVSDNWSRFDRPDGILAVGTNGNYDDAVEPNLALQVITYLAQAAAGQPVQLVPSHLMSNYVARFYVGQTGHSPPNNWSAYDSLAYTNAQMASVGL